jgi:hypothetical protein
VNYGVRYELGTPLHEPNHLTSAPRIVGTDGKPARYWDSGAYQIYVFNPQPPYDTDWRGWGPRVSVAWQATSRTNLHGGGSIVTLLPNIWQDNFLTGGLPMAFTPFISALPGTSVPFENAVAPFPAPPVYTPAGHLIFTTGDSKDVPANTPIDLQRFEQDLAAVSPGHQLHPLSLFGFETGFRNGYVATYSAGFEHDFGDIKVSSDYVATMGVHLPGVAYPNSYGGADPAFAPFTRFDASGQVTGGLAQEMLMASRSHSTFHSLQASASKSSGRYGLGLMANYTLSKSLDDTSSVMGPSVGGAGNVQLAIPQNPWNPAADKGPSTFDVRHILALSAVQVLPFDRVGFLHPLGNRITSGWQVLNITTLTSGSPFSVYSGIQQSGFGANGADRPDQVGKPVFSTGRKVREDYFGRGSDNTSFFSIPIGVPGGTGPNQGRLGTLGRDTFRGPANRDLDLAVIKDTPFGRRGAGEAMTLQIRAEFFNMFNLVNFGLPANVVRGTGFGVISRTAGTSRQLQFSLKLIF